MGRTAVAAETAAEVGALAELVDPAPAPPGVGVTGRGVDGVDNVGTTTVVGVADESELLPPPHALNTLAKSSGKTTIGR